MDSKIYPTNIKPCKFINTTEKCGIKIEGNDKWMTIIQNANQNQKK